MFPCTPYIPNMCQTVKIESADSENINEETKKDTEVKVTDVKSVKVELAHMVKPTDEFSVGSLENIPKEFSTFKPESPDVLRAAKILENSKKKISDNSEPSIQQVAGITEAELLKREQEKLGAVSKRFVPILFLFFFLGIVERGTAPGSQAFNQNSRLYPG